MIELFQIVLFNQLPFVQFRSFIEYSNSFKNAFYVLVIFFGTMASFLIIPFLPVKERTPSHILNLTLTSRIDRKRELFVTLVSNFCSPSEMLRRITHYFKDHCIQDSDCWSI